MSSTTLPTSLSDLILPFRPTLAQTLTSLKKSRLGIHSRLVSILEDSAFVTSVSEVNKLPLVANERCGSWYVPPEQKRGSVYFKSTDGHQGQWKFSLRRLNLELLRILNEHGGAVIVDSTRRGKSMPDALSKTVPIWVTVINRALFPERTSEHELTTPEDVVGQSEHAQIHEKLAEFVKEFQNLKLDLARLKAVLGKPIKVEFVSRQTSVIKMDHSGDYHLLICCSASRHEHGDGDGYVQGAGDDTENWAHGLTADLFWRHRDSLLKERNEEDLQSLIKDILIQIQENPDSSARICLQDHPTTLFLGSSSATSNLEMQGFDASIQCEKKTPGGSSLEKVTPNQSILALGCSPGKLGGKALRDKLPLVDDFVRKMLDKVSNPSIIIFCSTGSDISVGVALAILCRFVDESGNLTSEARQGIDKRFIRQQLAYITQSLPMANPSRATLQSVNTYLMGYVN